MERVAARDADRGIGSRHRKNRLRSDQRPIGSAHATPHSVDKRLDSPAQRQPVGGMEVLGADDMSSPVSDGLSDGDASRHHISDGVLDGATDGSLVEELVVDDDP